MARMVMFVNKYKGADAELAASKPLPETLAEIREAQRIVNIILKYNGIKITPVKASEDQGWNIPDVTDVWYAAGDETIDIPNLSERFRM